MSSDSSSDSGQGCRRKWLRPSEVALRYGIKADRVIVLIRTGLIRAIDVSSPESQRPRFRIHEDDLVAFEERREVRPAPTKTTRRRKASENVIEFF